VKLKPKRSISDLAVFGGEPAFEEPLHVGRPNIVDRRAFLDRVNDMLDRRWLTNDGPFVEEFERAVAGRIGVRNVVAVCNATIGLEIAARALDLRGEVLVPGFTFVASANALHWIGLTPVFCDIDASSLTIDPADAARRVTPLTTGLLGVHVYGRACDTDGLQRVADDNGLVVFYDAAHALGCTHAGRMVGTFGALEVFSFHATKFVNAFEGGAIATDDDELAERARLMRNFGFTGYDTTTLFGTNAKMTEVSAAMGLTSLSHIDELVEVNRVNFAGYRQALDGVTGLRLVEPAYGEVSNYQYVVVRIDAEAPLSRDGMLAVLQAENVLARRYFYPGVHELEPYRTLARHPLTLPIAERVSREVLALPTGTAMSTNEVAYVSDLIDFAMRHGSEIARRRGQPATVGGAED